MEISLFVLERHALRVESSLSEGVQSPGPLSLGGVFFEGQTNLEDLTDLDNAFSLVNPGTQFLVKFAHPYTC